MTAAAAVAALTAVVLAATPQVPGVDVVFSTTGARSAAVGDAAQGLAVRADLPVMERAAERAARIAVPLPTGDTVVTQLSSYDARANGFFAGGRLVAGAAEPPIDGEAAFTVVDGRLLGRIVHQDRLFIVRASAEAGVYAISEVDSSQLPNELQPVTPPRQPSEFDARIADAAVGGDSNQYVDLLVVYSAAARAAMGSTAAMQLEVVGAVDNANLALANGGVTHRLRLVYQTETSYVEAGEADLSRLADPDDGNMDEVHRLRDQYDADVVSFVGTSNACGVAYVMQSSSISVAAFHHAAFNVNHYSCIYSNLTMAHEIGHNMGLHHDRANASSTPAYPYAYGYRVPGSRTVMAYSCTSNYPGFDCNTRRAIFSTPAANFPGVTPATPAGVFGSENNALALNNTSPVVANFRDSTCSYALSTSASTFSGSGGSGTLTVTTGSGCAWTGVSSAPSTLALSSDPTYLGSRALTFTVASNSGASRSATIYAGGQSVVVSQDSSSSLTVPGAPTGVVGAPGHERVSVSFTSPSSNGGATITGYTVVASPGGARVTGAASPLVVSGLTNGIAYSFAVTATNSVGTGSPSTPSAVVAPVPTTVAATPTSLVFSATKNGASGDIVSVTPAQSVTVTFSGITPPQWAATSNQSWLRVSNASGSGAGRLTAEIVNPNNVIGAATSLSAVITLASTAASNPSVAIPVTFTINQTGASTAAAFGAIDAPANHATVSGTIAVSGWALDDVGVERVEIWRTCLTPIDSSRAGVCRSATPTSAADKVFIGTATFVPGARADIEATSQYAGYPQAYRAGWGYLLLTNALPNQTTGATEGGQGSVTLHGYAVDREGRYTELGSRTIILDNANATQPFGTIDTPGQGGTVTGALTASFGWAMTRRQNAAGVDVPKCIERSRYRVYIDGVARQLIPGTNWFPNLVRSDLTAAYPGLCDSANSLAAYYIDTMALGLANGLHTIGWDVYDDNGTPGTTADDNASGIGSRFFNVLVGAADGVSGDPLTARPVKRGAASDVAVLPPMGGRLVRARVGFVESAVVPVEVDGGGIRRVNLPSGSRLVVDLGGPAAGGYLLVGDQLRDLPVGSTLDRQNGQFYWQPPVPYFGAFDLVFVSQNDGNLSRTNLTVTIVDPTAGGDSEVTIASPRPGADPNPVLTVAGRAVDTLAATGSGIAAVHVWAYRIDVPDVPPRFLGAASLEADRYTLRTPALDPGSYDIAVFAWNTRLGAWAPAAVVSIAVR
jgi:hypothetical protein